MALPAVPIIGGLIQLGQTWLEGRAKKSQAKADAEAKVLVNASESVAEWERVMAKNSGHSWKDEYLTIVFTIPSILCFFPSAVPAVQAGFEVLETMPSWYQYTLSIIVAASFGVRAAIGLIKERKK